MKCFYGTLICLFCFFLCAGQQKNVLFIGNSLTYYNDMPQTVQKMINERKLEILIDQVTPDGVNLICHSKFKQTDGGTRTRILKGEISKTVSKILSKQWDIVILQETPISILIPEQRYYWTTPAVLYLDSIIKYRQGKTILYQNYALQRYPSRFCYTTGTNDVLFKGMAFDPEQAMKISSNAVCSDSFNNSVEEFNVLSVEISKLAATINAEIAQVGYFFELCKKRYPDIQLYISKENYHPTPEGSYLMACVFFKSITTEHLTDIKYSAKINKNIAKKLRELVESK